MRGMPFLVLAVLFFHDNYVGDSGRIHIYVAGRGNIEYHMTRVLKVRVPPELKIAFSDAAYYWRARTGANLFVSVEEDEDVAIEIARIGHFSGLAHMDGRLNLDDKVYNITGGWIKISPDIVGKPACENSVMVHELGHMLGLEDDASTGGIMDGRGPCRISALLDSDRELIMEDIRNAVIN